MPKNSADVDYILRLPEVVEMAGVQRATIYRYMADGIFPRSVKLGNRTVGWLQSEVQAWMAGLAAARDKQTQKSAKM